MDPAANAELAPAYYWPLVRNTLAAFAAAELIGLFGALLFPFIWSPDYADFAVAIVYYGCLLAAAQRTLAAYQRRDGATDADFGFSDEAWVGNALIGLLAAFALQSLRDLALAAARAAATGELGPGPLFTWVDVLLRAGRALAFAGVVKTLNAYLVPALVEEVYFRGIVYTVMARREGGLPAALGSSLAFSALHQSLIMSPFLGWQLSWSLLVYRAVLGLFFCWLRMRTRTILAGSLAHCLWNVFVDFRMGA